MAEMVLITLTEELEYELARHGFLPPIRIWEKSHIWSSAQMHKVLTLPH
jgi:hypothetical protein